MNRTALRLRPLEDQITTRDSAVTLRMVNGDTVADWVGVPENTADNPHCLLCLVALERPAIRSTLARRLRLRDILAGGDACRNAFST